MTTPRSLHTGVSWNSGASKWQVERFVFGVCRYCSTLFVDEDRAARMSDALALFHGEGEAFTEEDPPNLAITEETRANVAALCAAAIAEKLQRGSGIGTNDPIGGFGGGAVGGGGGADDGRAYADGAGGGGDGGAPATKRAKTGAAGSAEGGGDGRHEFGTWSEGDDSARLGRAVVGAKPMTQEPAGPKTADADEVLPPG